jgi:hypothetical protein
MIMAFLLVVIIDGEPIADQFYFRNIQRCNQFALWIETGKVNLVQDRRMMKQTNISAYCLPKRISQNTKTWD